jgi:hypothetical protein
VNPQRVRNRSWLKCSNTQQERDEIKAKSAKLASVYGQGCAGLFSLADLSGRVYLAQILEPNEYTAQVASFTPKETPSKF